MIKTITFEVETITPMFLAGADQSKAELRAASIKGLLRFWWRALQAESDMDELRKKEAKIFGSSEEGVGGSSFGIRIIIENAIKPIKGKFPKQNITVTSKGKSFPVNILEYLAYGTLEYKKGEGNVFLRDYIPSGTKFKLDFKLFDAAWKDEVLKTMYIFSLFGGLGSRSRNGFGSFCITNFQEAFKDLPENSINNLYDKEILKVFLKNRGIKSYPSFVNGTKVFKSKTAHQTWDSALAEAGKLYRSIRSGEIKHNDKAFESKHHYDKRQYIGAPLIVEKKDKSFLDRHAKPYFIKIAKEGNRYKAYILYLPSKYCDGLEKDRNNHSINHSSEDRKFADVCTEFNSFLADNMETVI